MSKLAPPKPQSVSQVPSTASTSRSRAQRKKRTTHWSSPVVENAAQPTLQRALEVSKPEDEDEQEADAVAEQVMRKEEVAWGGPNQAQVQQSVEASLISTTSKEQPQEPEKEDDEAENDSAEDEIQRAYVGASGNDDEDTSSRGLGGSYPSCVVQRKEETLDEGAFGAYTSLLSTETLQTKLVVGSVNDPLEREADEVAERVMRMADPDIVGSSENNEDAIHRAPTEEEEPLRGLGGSCAGCGVQRKEEDESTVQCASTEDDAINKRVATPVTESITALRRNGGTPLPRFIRQDFERRF